MPIVRSETQCVSKMNNTYTTRIGRIVISTAVDRHKIKYLPSKIPHSFGSFYLCRENVNSPVGKRRSGQK